MEDKVIVTNRGALQRKYGSKGLSSINKALKALVAADKKRGIGSVVVYLDDNTGMKKRGAPVVQNAGSPRENKAAIDAIYKKLTPDYMMILGAPDVVPHQDLYNPAYTPGDDDDRYAWGDLPYACDAAYSRDAARFVGPTRVLGRLPDMVAASEPSYLLGLLKTAAGYTRRRPNDYAKYFGLSAAEWQGSTRMSLDNIFGNTSALRLSPTQGPTHPSTVLNARMHFINCHGGDSSPEFQGQKGSRYPIALTTRAIKNRITEGAVAAVECCYGGELYDALTLGIDMPICQSYLHQGAYGYLGSTTIAYGPADSNGAADLVCQHFLLNVLGGASTGRAALMARQQFVSDTGQMDPFDLKTLAQFCLLGDPSVHPVALPGEPKSSKSIPLADIHGFARAERRAKLKATGDFLRKTKPTASKRVEAPKITSGARTALGNIAKAAGLSKAQAFKTFAVKGGTSAQRSGAKAAAVPTCYHIAIGRPKGVPENKISHGIAVVAKEMEGRIVGYRIYHQR